MAKEDKKTGLKVNKGIEQPSYLNTKFIKDFKNKKGKLLSVEQYIDGILNNDRTILSKAITLVESVLPKHQAIAQEIIEKCMPHTGNSIRIGITGVPGVGKSTFIEALGMKLIKEKHKIAVLAIDPSSSRSKGSILGDKTRMNELSTEENAFIRPSPSAGTLGGVAQKTRETILLCEAAGFNIIFVETVGVGQSETAVHSMVDFFLMLMLAGAGDELQGIKRGIMEISDLIVINKADNTDIAKIKLAQHTYLNALHLFPPTKSGWQPLVEYCSSLTSKGIDNIWQIVNEYQKDTTENKYFENRRKEQAAFWLHESIRNELENYFYNHPLVKNKIIEFEKMVIDNKISPFVAAKNLLKLRLDES